MIGVVCECTLPPATAFAAKLPTGVANLRFGNVPLRIFMLGPTTLKHVPII